MKRFGRVAMVTLITGLAAAQIASAQIAAGMPAYPVRGGLGFSAMADAGFAENATVYALTGGVGFSRIGLQVTLGSTDFDVLGSEVNYGAQAGFRVFGGGLNPLAIGVQAGYSRIDLGGGVTSEFIPVGASVRFSPPLFPLKPYGVVYYDAGDLEEVRISAGLDFNLLLGFGAHAAYDWGDKGSTWGIGAHFTFGQ